MTKGLLVNRDTDELSVEKTQSCYDRRLIPAEKKPFLIDFERCSGPYLAVEQGHYILDAASQIASFGLGFNAGAMFGACQFLETWTGNEKTAAIRQVRRAFEELLQRKIGWPELYTHLCNSGAEAVETALGICYQRRRNRFAQRVIAFEGSFHGRMMVALATTWDARKREPFQWSGFEAQFAPYPEMDSDDVNGPVIPGEWNSAWSESPSVDLAESVRTLFGGEDRLLKAETESLLQVRDYLVSGSYYAILIEPMQCEGGDRYSSARFHQGLVHLANAFSIPLVYDEIQTGLGLGGEFFGIENLICRIARAIRWHQTLWSWQRRPRRESYCRTNPVSLLSNSARHHSRVDLSRPR